MGRRRKKKIVHREGDGEGGGWMSDGNGGDVDTNQGHENSE